MVSQLSEEEMMVKAKKTVEFESDRQYDDPNDPDAGGDGGDQHPEQQPARDPNQPREYVVMTDGAVFPRDKFSMKAADVPPPPEPEDSDTVTCHIGDIVSLTDAEADAKRASGIALGGPREEHAV